MEYGWTNLMGNLLKKLLYFSCGTKSKQTNKLIQWYIHSHPSSLNLSEAEQHWTAMVWFNILWEPVRSVFLFRQKYHDHWPLLRKKTRIFFSLELMFQNVSDPGNYTNIFHMPCSYLANLSWVLSIVFVFSVSLERQGQNIGLRQMLIFSLLGTNGNFATEQAKLSGITHNIGK